LLPRADAGREPDREQHLVMVVDVDREAVPPARLLQRRDRTARVPGDRLVGLPTPGAEAAATDRETCIADRERPGADVARQLLERLHPAAAPPDERLPDRRPGDVLGARAHAVGQDTGSRV